MAMKLSFVAAAAFAFFVCSVSSFGENVLDGVAAVVNNDVIPFAEVRKITAEAEAKARQELRGEALQAKIKELRSKALNDLIDRKRVEQESSKTK
jgi:parvulin-like peptidyl-prolyl isomerase